jgi:hypothetical protein
MHDEKSPENLNERPDSRPSVERVDPSEFDAVARVLAEAYTNDPIHIWAMSKAQSRLKDATMFFSSYLRRMNPQNRHVFATEDRSAVVVTSIVHQGKTPYPHGVLYLPKLARTISPITEYFQWLETFRPKVDHLNLEFFGCLPTAPRGTGFFLVSNVLKIFDQQKLPVWTWSSNPLNLPFFHRQGFEIGAELRLNDTTPPVTIIWRPPMPLVASSSVGLRGDQ